MTLLSAIKEFPSGTLIDYAGTVEPNGWFLCDGRAISRTTYAGLFASISTAYGVGDGSTTFNIPDFRGRFARYNDNMGTAAGAASRDTGRVHGSAQAGSVEGHSHFELQKFGAVPLVMNASGSGGSTRLAIAATSGTYTAYDNLNTINNSGVETRPINISCNKLIKV